MDYKDKNPIKTKIMFEKVNPCHPDKVADRIAGAIVDLAYTKNKNPKVAVEVLLGHGKATVMIESSEDFRPVEMEGISQQELADRAGLTRQHIGRIEKGELVSVAYVTIQQIAEALGMTVDIIDPGLQDLAPLKRLTP